MTDRKNATRTLLIGVAAAALAPGVSGGNAAVSSSAAASGGEALTYADLADLFGPAPLVVRARISEATQVKGAAGPAGTTRFYIQGDVVSLIRGPQNVPPRLAWVVDLVPDSRGKLPRLKKTDVLIAALPVTGRPGEIRLAARDAQLAWSAALENRVRAISAAAASSDAPPAIIGVGGAFHVAGSIPGEGETQIFLKTASGAPVSLSILRRPGEAPRWAFAQGEIVDEAAAPPARDTLAWYRLACFLPPALPDSAVAELAAADADAAREDYAFVVAQLGPCTRTRQR